MLRSPLGSISGAELSVAGARPTKLAESFRGLWCVVRAEANVGTLTMSVTAAAIVAKRVRVVPFVAIAIPPRIVIAPVRSRGEIRRPKATTNLSRSAVLG
jgi:hypothetical protein